MRSSPTGYTSPHTASPRRAGAEIRDAVRCGPGRRSEGCRAPVESAERGYYPVGEAEGDRAAGRFPIMVHAGGSGAESGCRASGPDSETPRERARRVAVRRPRDTFDRYACDTSGQGSRLLFSIDVYTRDALHHRAPESFSAVSSRRPSERPQLLRRGSSRARVRHISATASRRACSGAFTNRRRQCASPTTPAMTNFSPHDPMTPPVTPSTHSPILRALMTCLAFDVAHVVARSGWGLDCTFTRGRLTPPNSPLRPLPHQIGQPGAASGGHTGRVRERVRLR